MDEELIELFQDNSIGCYPVSNDNGADSYWCPGCGAHKDVKGYVGGMSHITEVNHRVGCRLMELYNKVMKL
jgi:hypothetical protein